MVPTSGPTTDPSGPDRGVLLRFVRDNAAIALVYWGVSQGNYALFSSMGILPMPVWPAASIAVAAALVWGWRAAPGIAIGSTLANALALGTSWPIAISVSVMNSIGPVVGANLAKRYSYHMPPFLRTRDTSYFLLFCVALMAALTATGGIASIVIWSFITPDLAVNHWLRWWVGHSSGALLFAPTILCWWPSQRKRDKSTLLEFAVVAVGVLTLTAWMFWSPRHPSVVADGLPYLLIIPLAWAAIRLPVDQSTALFPLTALVAMIATVTRHGPFSHQAMPMVTLGFMVISYGLTALMLSASSRERKDAESDKRQFYRDTISSVTDGKLQITGCAELRKYEQTALLTCEIRSPEDVSMSRHIVKGMCAECQLGEEETTAFLIALGEAETNALKHAGGGRLYAGCHEDEVWVDMSDQGHGIATLKLPSATLRRGYSTKVSMGMGYSLMLEACDSVLLCTGSEGTSVVLTKSATHKPGLSLEDLPDTWNEPSGI